MKQAVDPGLQGFNATKLIHDLTERHDIHPANGFDLDRGTLILGWTRETVDLKENCRMAARVEGKSSLARVGLGIHVTAPIIHTGFKAPFSLKSSTMGRSQFASGAGCEFANSYSSRPWACPTEHTKGSFLDRLLPRARAH
jgi:dCTP deaminase